MKIEKISDTQVKFILTKDDFKERDLHISELTYNSEKAQSLFRDMMTKASLETGFVTDHTPLIIEAMPLSSESLMVIVSKVSGSRDEHISPISSLLEKIKDIDDSDLYTEFKKMAGAEASSGGEKLKLKIPKNIAIYSFDTLDEVSMASGRLGSFRGASSLHKLNGKYFMCLQLPYKTAAMKMPGVENIMGEYGVKHVSNSISKGFLLEHAETIISSGAVNKLSLI